MIQKRVGLVLITGLHEDIPKHSLVALAETLKRYHDFSVLEENYSFIRMEFPPLTSKLKYDILLALPGANKLNRHPIERRR
jgi:hypothetical protein